MKVYLAGRYERQRELCAVAAELVYLGHEVTSTWLHSTQQRTDEAESAADIARRNWEDLSRADIVACFTEAPGSYPGGDRHVEYGIALACWGLGVRNSRGLPMDVCTVGPLQLTFHSLPGVPNYPTVEQFFIYMRQINEGV